MLAAIAMEYPSRLETNSVRNNRARILETFPSWTDETVRENTYRAQYRGYQSIDGVQPDSETETYFALKTESQLPKWRGIPIVMEAGKRMMKVRKEIVLTLKHPPVCHLCEAGSHAPNRIVFRLEPNDEIVIHFWTKKPGFEQRLEERAFSFFLYEKDAKTQYVEEYAKVFYAAMSGEQKLFISPEEVAASWQFIDPIVDGWRRNIVPLAEYEPDTTPTPAILQNVPDNKDKKIETRAHEIGMIGLGKMGANLVRQLHSKRWKVVGFDKSVKATKELEKDGFDGVYSLREFVGKLSKPRLIWLMVSHQVVDAVLDELTPLLQGGDTVIDGGNSPYRESVRRSKGLEGKGINFLDVGVSGGPAGARGGACLMIGGERELYKKHEQLFRDLSAEGGYGYMGKSGAGHFVKMVHNGIEYGIMQAIGEGFEIMKKSPFSLNLHTVSELYNHGSVIESRLVGWLAEAYSKFSDELNAEECCSGSVSHSGEGQWTVDVARELGVPAAIIEGALEFRKKSQEHPSYTGRVVSALRHQFGGHDARDKGNQKKN